MATPLRTATIPQSGVFGTTAGGEIFFRKGNTIQGIDIDKLSKLDIQTLSDRGIDINKLPKVDPFAFQQLQVMGFNVLKTRNPSAINFGSFAPATSQMETISTTQSPINPQGIDINSSLTGSISKSGKVEENIAKAVAEGGKLPPTPSPIGTNGGFVKVGDAFFKQSPSGLQAVSDPTALSGLKAGTTPFTEQAMFTGGAKRFAPTTSDLPQVIIAPKKVTDETPDLPTPQVESVQDAFNVSLQGSVDTNRKVVEDAYKKQLEDLQRRIDESNQKIEELTTLQAEGIEKAGDLLQPFREDLENAERERLKITENFEANQALINELDTLLAEGNELIRQQKEITGLSAIRNPRIDKTISDVNARVGVIEAVINARNGQIGQAFNMIDRTTAAITADRNDQLTYYNTLLDFYQNQKDDEGKKLVTLSRDKKDFMNAQINLLENDLAQSSANASYIKELMQDPDTASFIASAGVTLNDTPEQVNAKMASQSQVQQIEDFKNERISKGFEFVPMPTGGADEVQFTVGGKTLVFKKPPEDVDSGVGGQTKDKPMSVNQIEQFRRSYGWTPPAGYTWNQLVEYVNANPNATPEELEAGANQVINETTPTTDTTTTEPEVTQTVPELVTSIMDTITDDQLKALKGKADEAGISSMWKPKTTDVKNYLNSITGDLQDAIDFGYTLDETIAILIQ